MSTLEKEIEQKLRKNVEDLGGKCLKWVCPGWSGVPDRIVLLPGGRIYFVELKRPRGGVLSPMQKKWRDWLQRLGFRYVLIWDRERLDRFLCLLETRRVE